MAAKGTTLRSTIDRIAPIIFLLLAAAFLTKSILFVKDNGGIEHDSGWLLGVAKTIAEKGIYASPVNTITQSGKGTFPSIHGRYSVQDESGYVYFPAAVSVGPGYLLPEAMILKIFGTGWWQYRAWPLLAYGLLLFFLFLMAKKLGGWLGLAFFASWLWLIPQLTLAFSFEAYSEPIALLFIVASIVLVCRPKKQNYYIYFLAGTLLGLAILTKLISALTIVAFVALLSYDLLQPIGRRRIVLYRWLIFGLGVGIPILLFLLYRYYYLISNFGINGYDGVKSDLAINFQVSGGDINRDHFSLHDLKTRLGLWGVIGLRLPSLIWVLFLASCCLLANKWKMSPEQRRMLLVVVFSIITFFAWFTLSGATAWGRYIWSALILSMVILSAGLSTLVKAIWRPGLAVTWIGAGLVILLSIFLLRPEMLVATSRIGTDAVDRWYAERDQSGLRGFPDPPVFPLKDQTELVSFFNKSINDQDRIYYLGIFLVAEVPAFTSKIIFPIERYQEPAHPSNSYLIMGPYQQGKYALVGSDYLPENVNKYRRETVFSNPSYTVCALK